MNALSIAAFSSAVIHVLLLLGILFFPAIEKKPEPEKVAIKINPAHFFEPQITEQELAPIVEQQPPKQVVAKKQVQKPKPKPKQKPKPNKEPKPKKVVKNPPKKQPLVKKKVNNAPTQNKLVTTNYPPKPPVKTPPVQPSVSAPKKLPPPKPDPNVKNRYVSKIAGMISRKKSYPSVSQRKGEEGTVYIAFTITKSGAIKNPRVSKSSGISRLDNAALSALKKAAKKFPPLPPELGSQLPITVPIQFSLKR